MSRDGLNRALSLFKSVENEEVPSNPPPSTCSSGPDSHAHYAAHTPPTTQEWRQAIDDVHDNLSKITKCALTPSKGDVSKLVLALQSVLLLLAVWLSLFTGGHDGYETAVVLVVVVVVIASG